MRLPDDYDDRSGLTPTVVSAIVAVTMFVAVILVVVLLINHDDRGSGNHNAVQSTQQTPQPASSGIVYPDTDEILSGSKLTPDDLDFWDMYPPSPSPSVTPEPAASSEAVQSDPATDGKHTLIQYSNGKEEWVLISPYLPKHDYDFTKLVCQSDLMKYYEDGKQVSCVGLDVGVYFYSQAVTVDEAIEEANLVIENLGEYQITYPVAFDMELIENDTARTDTLSKTERTAITKAFLDTIAAAGYKTIIYGNKQWLIKEIDMSKLTAYDVWLAQEADIPDYPYKFTMWQYSKTGNIDGIAGYVDLNISFIDYSEK